MKKKAASKMKKAPSRERYEGKTRIFSARLPIETYDKIIENLAMRNMSKADALKVLAGEMAIKPLDLEKIKQEAWDKGYDEGVNGAVETFAIIYNCSKCGREEMVDRVEEKEAIKRFIHKQRWVCEKCSS